MRIEKRFMEYALEEAKMAGARGETPVGAVVVREGGIVSRAGNEVEARHDARFHAELTALSLASAALGTRDLSDCVLYVTMEPCPMCAGACLNYRIGAVAFGAYDARCGALGSRADVLSGEFGRETPVIGGVMRAECASLLTDFFKDKR